MSRELTIQVEERTARAILEDLRSEEFAPQHPPTWWLIAELCRLLGERRPSVRRHRNRRLEDAAARAEP